MTKNKLRNIHFFIMFLLTICICLCPTFGQITPYGMKVLGIFIGVLYGWIFIDLIWPSLFGFAALAISNVTTIGSALSSGFGNTQLLLMLVVMIFAGALDDAGFTDLIGTWLLRKKIFQKNPWNLIAGILITGYVIGLAGPAMAAVFLLWAICIRIADMCHIPKKDPVISFLIFGIVASAFAGNYSLPWHPTTAIFNSFLSQDSQVSIPYISFSIYAITITVVVIGLLFLIAKFVLRIDASKFILPEELIQELQCKQFTKKQIISLWILVVYLLALLLPEIVFNVPGISILKELAITGVTVIALLFMNLITIDNQPLIDLSKTFSKHVQWPLILLLAVTFPIADALKSADAGIMPTISAIIMPTVSQMGLIPFMIISIIILGLLTQITHNIVLGALFMPFLCPLCEQLGGNPIIMWFMLYFVLLAAYGTPAASMQGAMIHGHEYMNSKHAYLWGFIFLALSCLVLILIGLPLGNLLF